MIDSLGVPALTAGQMREVDRIMAEDLHIELVQMMENAGRSLAELALRRFRPATVTVLAGPGGNGGGGLVAARLRPARRSGRAHRRAHRLGEHASIGNPGPGQPERPGRHHRPRRGACIRAAATLTLALPKAGLAAAGETGELFLADISVPPAVYRRLGLTVPPLFGHDTIIELAVPPGSGS